MMDMDTDITNDLQKRLDLTPGEWYACTLSGKRGPLHMGHYSPIAAGGGVGRHVHSGQLQVAYVGLDGPDQGKLFFTPLADWDKWFRRVER
jgi:hypothetical protein